MLLQTCAGADRGEFCSALSKARFSSKTGSLGREGPSRCSHPRLPHGIRCNFGKVEMGKIGQREPKITRWIA